MAHQFSREEAIKGGKAKAAAIAERKKAEREFLLKAKALVEDHELAAAERMKEAISKQAEVVIAIFERLGAYALDNVEKHPKMALDVAAGLADRILGKPGQELTMKGNAPVAFLWEHPAVEAANRLAEKLDKPEHNGSG